MRDAPASWVGARDLEEDVTPYAMGSEQKQLRFIRLPSVVLFLLGSGIKCLPTVDSSLGLLD